MDLRRLSVFVLIPVVVTLVCLGLYFSGVPWMERLVAPSMDGMYVNTWREFGLVENLQNLLLLATIAVTVTGLGRKPHLWERLLLGAIGLLALFVFLEEVDYGLHWYEWLRGIGADEAAEVRNWHNQSGRTSVLKRVVDVGMLTGFVLLPLLLRGRAGPVVDYLLPSRWFAATLVCVIGLSELAHALNDAGLNPDGALESNMSEFRETITYYAGLVYVVEFVFFRRSPGLPPGTATRPA